MLKFPANFFWGAATSAHQVEGNNTNSDWWVWEKKTGLKETSSDACRSYELYLQDFDLAKQLNHNAHRFSVEWSRIQPKRDEFSEQELRHYRDVLSALKERGLEPIVTLHHFTNPVWFAEAGGWENKDAPELFLRYAEKVVNALGGSVRFWVTINEPMVYIYHAYLLGVWPPQKISIFKTKKVIDNMVKAHIKVYRLINRIYREKKLTPPLISIAQNIQAFVPCKPTLINKIACSLRHKYYNLDFLERIKRAHALDFIGVNYYSRSVVEVKGPSLRRLFSDTCTENHNPLKKNSLGWDIYPQGLYDVAISLKKFKLPLFILENGICTSDDNLRWEFIYEHLKSIHRAMEQGVKFLGYIYWALIDNYEWDKGFGPRFGLIEVDYNNYRRTIRPSALKLAEVAKSGILS